MQVQAQVKFIRSLPNTATQDSTGKEIFYATVEPDGDFDAAVEDDATARVAATVQACEGREHAGSGSSPSRFSSAETEPAEDESMADIESRTPTRTPTAQEGRNETKV